MSAELFHNEYLWGTTSTPEALKRALKIRESLPGIPIFLAWKSERGFRYCLFMPDQARPLAIYLQAMMPVTEGDTVTYVWTKEGPITPEKLLEDAMERYLEELHPLDEPEWFDPGKKEVSFEGQNNPFAAEMRDEIHQYPEELPTDGQRVEPTHEWVHPLPKTPQKPQRLVIQGGTQIQTRDPVSVRGGSVDIVILPNGDIHVNDGQISFKDGQVVISGGIPGARV